MLLSLTTQCKRVTAADSSWQDMQTRDHRRTSDGVSPLVPSATTSATWSTLVYLRLPSSTLVYPRLPSSTLVCTLVYAPSTLVYPRLPSSALVYPCLPSSTLVYPRLPPSTPVYPHPPPVYPRLPSFARFYPCPHCLPSSSRALWGHTHQ